MYDIIIENSYDIWSFKEMKGLIDIELTSDFNLSQGKYISMYIEWLLHNIGYYTTKPFCFIEKFNKINLRCKDVNLEIFFER